MDEQTRKSIMEKVMQAAKGLDERGIDKRIIDVAVESAKRSLAEPRLRVVK